MRGRRLWAVIAALVGVVGMAASAAGADALADNQRDDATRRFNLAASEVAARVKSEVRHVEDLVVNAQAFLRRTPNQSASDLRSWATDVDLFNRHPVLRALGLTTIVPDAELDRFIAIVTADPPDNSEPGIPFHLVPAGRRAAYCLMQAGVARPEVGMPLGRDLCPNVSPEVVAAMKSMDPLVVPTTLDEHTYLSIASPLYRTVEIPATPEERQAQFVAIFGLILDPTELLTRVVANQPGFIASLDFRDESEQLLEPFSKGSFTTGPLPARPRTRVIDLGEGWTVTVATKAPDTGITDNSNARTLLIGGGLLSLLLAVLLYVLATGRARALRLVAAKTDELRHQALHDPLTGLANRALMNDRADQLLARSRRNDDVPVCLYLDLDGFKNINDSLGHEAGDLLLIAVASRLRGAVRDADTIARMGGDEFLVLLDGATTDSAPEIVAERILDVLRQPLEVDGVDTVMRVTASIGIAVGERPCGDDLVRDADLALYEAKAAGRNRAVAHRPGMQAAAQHDIEFEFDLRAALEREQFRLVYQPIYNLDDLSLVGFEALLRWEHPTLGLVQPNDFIPVLERTGQIVEVGRWVLQEACRQLATWRRNGSTATVSVNVSGQQFDSGSLVDDVRAAVGAADLDPVALTIEITESALMRSLPATLEQLAILRDFGVQVAIDDFGTGYSSLASLQRLPVDTLKIDRSFIAAMEDGPQARAMVRTIAQLGKDLGLRTLAEGVETTEQMDDLRADLIDEAQGFLLARPLDPATVERTILGTVPVH